MSDKNDVRNYPGAGIFTILFFAYLYLPILIVVLYSFNENRLVSVWTGFSLKWYASALSNEELLNALRTSLLIAFTATTVATVIAVMSAMILVRAKGVKYRRVSETIINLPLLLPEIVLAVAVLILFAEIGLSNGFLKLAIAHTTFCIPFAFLPIRARLQGMELDLDEASKDLYANGWTTFRRVVFPLIIPGVFAGAMLAFVMSMDDFITSSMLNTGGTTTLPVYIFGLVRKGVTPELNAISSIVIVVSVLVISLAAFLMTRLRD